MEERGGEGRDQACITSSFPLCWIIAFVASFTTALSPLVFTPCPLPHSLRSISSSSSISTPSCHLPSFPLYAETKDSLVFTHYLCCLTPSITPHNLRPPNTASIPGLPSFLSSSVQVNRVFASVCRGKCSIFTLFPHFRKKTESQLNFTPRCY